MSAVTLLPPPSGRYACEDCGHVVHHRGILDGPVEHLPDGGHRWSVTVRVDQTWRGNDA